MRYLITAAPSVLPHLGRGYGSLLEIIYPNLEETEYRCLESISRCLPKLKFTLVCAASTILRAALSPSMHIPIGSAPDPTCNESVQRRKQHSMFQDTVRMH